MEIANVRSNGVVILRLQGDLRRGDPVDALKNHFDGAFEEGVSQFVLNLADVNMVDSSGLGVIVRSLTHAKKSGGSVLLVSPSRLAMQTIKTCGLLPIFSIYEEEGEALASFDSSGAGASA